MNQFKKRHEPFPRRYGKPILKHIIDMKKNNGPIIIIIASSLLIILDIIFLSNQMNIGFWMRILINGLLILSMVLSIRDRKKEKNKE